LAKLFNWSSVSFAPLGTAHVLSSPFTSEMMGGPFCPAGARWMWAIVPAMPMVFTDPLTEPSLAIEMVPFPLACVLTAGTSCAPVSFTATSPAMAPIEITQENAAAAKDRAITDVIAFIVVTSPVENTGRPYLLPRLAVNETIGMPSSFKMPTTPELPLVVAMLGVFSLLSATAVIRAGESAEPAGVIDACTLLLVPEIERVIHAKVDSGERRDEGAAADGSYSSTCVWKIRIAPGRQDPQAPLGGQSFVILNAVRWPAGSGLAHRFLDGFRAAAARGEIFHTPIPKPFGQEALWWGDGLAVRENEVSFGISVFSGRLQPKYRGFFEEQLAPDVLRRVKVSDHP
jgi:hypothetical protein